MIVNYRSKTSTEHHCCYSGTNIVAGRRQSARSGKLACKVLEHQDLKFCSLSGPDWIPLLPLCSQKQLSQIFKLSSFVDLKALLTSVTQDGTFKVQSVPTEFRSGANFQKGVSPKAVSIEKVAKFASATSRNVGQHPWAKYFIVDFEPDSDPRVLFTEHGITRFRSLLGRIGRIAVIVSNSATVSSCHKDGSDAIAIVLVGSKTFRVRTDGGSNVFNPFSVRSGGGRKESRNCPIGWTDISMKPGDMLYVPKGELHAVQSKPKSILVSMTLVREDLMNLDSEVGATSTEFFGAPDSPMRSESESEESHIEVLSPDLFRSDELGLKSEMSQMTSKWGIDGMSMVTEIDCGEELESALGQVRKVMFDEATMTLLPKFGSEYVWGKLFGQKHIKDVYDDPRSGRVNTTMGELLAFDEELGKDLKKAVQVITDHVTLLCKQYNGDFIVKVTSAALLIRLGGRIPAQRMHVDGSCENIGHGTELSCMAALNDHKGVVFVDIANAGVVRPHLRVGKVLVFDHSGRTHQGHHTICDNEQHLTGGIVFVTYLVKTSSETQVKVRHDRVDDRPDQFVRCDTDLPVVTSCVVCETPIFQRDLANLRLCGDCDDHQLRVKMLLRCDDGKDFGGDVPVSVVCHVCVHTPVGPHTTATMETLAQLAATDQTAKFMMNSVMCDCDAKFSHLRLCNHPEARWQPFVPAVNVLLYIQLSELKATACWLIVLHLNNVLLSGYMIPELSSFRGGNRFSQFVNWAGGVCGRRGKIIDVMCQFVGVNILSGQANPQFTLFCDIEDGVFIRAFGARIERLARFIETPLDEIERVNDAFMLVTKKGMKLTCECAAPGKRGGYVFCVPQTRRISIDARDDDSMSRKLQMEMDNVKEWLSRQHSELYHHLLGIGLKV